jgi:Tetracyclin repressor-like, C-terminal domain
VAAVQAGQELGIIDPSLDARDIVMFVIALAAWPAATPQLARQITGDLTSDESRARYRADVVEAVRRIVSPSA